ncbi:hypothetical protein FJ661_04995 [Pseudarthrobacter phenanthrenivorans]|uniref:SRPBCC family protein n=1 Tax=Pseudarthrobacter phenanthrenivorans TaxID=361575 RepID=UPI0011272890|nr:SRPBCC family protein [Pseudarthrobacter phenanthrenivorans]TPV52650.1 hypothetical protein FJ661_04995 [Pseudarthrobacter phenanthrenivorans]
MPTIEESILIHKTPQEVFDYVTAPSSPLEWDTAIIEYRQDDVVPHVGSRSTGTTKVLGRRIEWTVEVIEYDPPHRIVSRSVQSPLQFTVAFSTKAQEGGTLFTVRLDTESGLGGVFGRIADPLVAAAYARSTRANLETLAEILTEHEK